MIDSKATRKAPREKRNGGRRSPMTQYHVPLHTKCLVVALSLGGVLWLAKAGLDHEARKQHGYGIKDRQQLSALIDSAAPTPDGEYMPAKPVVLSVDLQERAPAEPPKPAQPKPAPKAKKPKMSGAERAQAMFDLYQCRGKCSRKEFLAWADQQ